MHMFMLFKDLNNIAQYPDDMQLNLPRWIFNVFMMI